ncbi:aldehyde-activating protein [Dyella monticola]|uniref:Aldehyde-activating protein n=1 Tax=Dyella monticola TaxID=1927958 RepID=A0A370X884_9GAMM|nr:GFA family protein [Dyella monticola]RDS84598.1 aldehyde-activating protein [Dyella monticola]
MNEGAYAFEGGCDCRRVRYRMTDNPLFVHCCHCRWCQRETGSAFALNAMIEAERVELLCGEVDVVHTPSCSGRGQNISRCPECRLALWSTYAGAGELIRFVRVGTLDDPDRFPPDIHIYTQSKQPWVMIPAGVPVLDAYYDRETYWPQASLQRRRALLAKVGRAS